MRRTGALALLVAGAVGLGGCQTADESAANATEDEAMELTLGPKDGLDLPPVDLDRVKVGDLAPDFSAVSLAGPVVTLSDFRGKKNVVLVFYRGHW
jgi:hypothetical protein